MTDAWSILTPEEETRLRDRAARSANGSHFQIAPPEARHNWPDPKPIKSHLPPVKAFDPELLPDALRDYVMDVSDRQQAPPDFAAVAGLCGIAAIAGNEVRIKPKAHDDWEIVPNIWGGDHRSPERDEVARHARGAGARLRLAGPRPARLGDGEKGARNRRGDE